MPLVKTVIRHFAIYRLERVHKADALKRFIFAGGLVVGVLNVHRGDVIRQQHDFIAVQLVRVFVRQRGPGNVPHEVDDEIAGAGERVEDMDLAVGQSFIKLRLQDVLHAGDHEVDERLRRVNDAVRVGHLHAKALKEPLINGVEEGLLLVEIGDGGGGVFNRAVKMFEALAEIVATEGSGIERGDDLFNLQRDDVALHEIAHVENFAEDALGEDVLDDHLLDGLDGDVGIERAAAEGTEIFKRGDEFLVGLAFLFDEGFQACANLRDFVFEFLDGLFPFRDGGRGEFQKQGEDFDKVVGFGQVGFPKPFAVLVKHGAVGLPEKNVLLGIAD